MSRRSGNAAVVIANDFEALGPVEILEASVETHRVPKVTIPPEAMRPREENETEGAKETRKMPRFEVLYDVVVDDTVEPAIELPYAPRPHLRRFNPDAVTQPIGLGVARRAAAHWRYLATAFLMVAVCAAIIKLMLVFEPWRLV